MKRKNILIIVAVLTCTANIFATKTVGIIVNKDLYSSIKTALDTYIAGVKAIEGKNIWLNATTFGATNNKTQLKDSLKTHYQTDSLEGAILIGDLPLARYTNTSDFNGSATFVCDLYYMDLNGIWTPETTPTSHSGDKKPEIWISRLTCSVIASTAGATESSILNKYFPKVVIRMTGQDKMPRKLLVVGQKDIWGGLEKENTDTSALDYNASITTTGTTATIWKNGLIAGQEYGYIYSHSGETFHQISPGYSISDIYKDATDCRFYNSYACSNGNYAKSNMVGAYATEDQGIICVGSSKTGSMCPGTYKPYNVALGHTKVNFGEAFKIWFAEKGINDVSWHYGMNLQGVGTIHLQPYSATTIKPEGNKRPTRFKLNATKSHISFLVPEMKNNAKSRVTIALYTTKGACAKTLLDTELSAGMHSVAINRKVTASGLYICRVKINDLQESMTIVNK